DPVVMVPVGEPGELIDELLIPIPGDELDEAVLALRRQRLCPFLLRAGVTLGEGVVALQETDEIMRLELAGAANVLRDADTDVGAVEDRRGDHLALQIGGPEPAANLVDDVDDVGDRVAAHQQTDRVVGVEISTTDLS